MEYFMSLRLPWLKGKEITGRPSDTWIVDFNERSETDAALYQSPFEYIRTKVKPFRDVNNRARRRRFWWQHGETVRFASEGSSRFVLDWYPPCREAPVLRLDLTSIATGQSCECDRTRR
jgi:hypothetical protein